MQVQRDIAGVTHVFENVVGTPWWVRRTRAPLSMVVVAHQLDTCPLTVDYHPRCGFCFLGVAHTAVVHSRTVTGSNL